MQQLVRRRGLYLLRVLVEQDDKDLSPQEQQDEEQSATIRWWNKYVACFEVIELESEMHLIDQIWDTVTELFEQIVQQQEEKDGDNVSASPSPSTAVPPALSWDWMQLLLGRAVAPPQQKAARDDSSSILRKLGVYRLLKGQAGIRVGHEPEVLVGKKSQARRGAPLQMLTVDFLFSIVIPSYDSLVTSVGTNMQTTEASANLAKSNAGGSKTKMVSEDMEELLGTFVGLYLSSLLDKEDKSNLEEFFRRLWSIEMLDKCRKKTCVVVFQTVEKTLKQYSDQEKIRGCIPVADDMLATVAESINYAFVYGSVLPMHKDALMQALATMLSYSRPKEKRNAPNAILSVLALYPVPALEDSQDSGLDADVASSLERDPALSSLRIWLKGNNDGAPVATAFVDGFMLSALPSGSDAGSSASWDPKAGCTSWERNTAKAVALLCILPSLDASATEGSIPASEMLWPAIFKGLSHAPAAMIGTSWTKADRVSRALLLLEIGCQLQVLSGMGNGTMVVDKKTQHMMPPPPKIEAILANSVSFVAHHIRFLMASRDEQGGNGTSSGKASRSSDARILSSTFARLVALLKVLSNGFLASMAISTTVNEVLNKSLEALTALEAPAEGNPVLHVALVYAALSSGAEIDAKKALPASTIILKLEFDAALAQRMGNGQAVRSVFQYAKWGALSCLLPKLLDASSNSDTIEVKSLLDDLFEAAADAVQSAPSNAIIPLFNCLVASSKSRFSKKADEKGLILIPEDIRYLGKVIAALFGLVEDSKNTNDAMYMMDEICSLIFQPALLHDEYLRLQDDSGCDTPIRDAFQRFVKMAGSQRSHISRVVLSRLCASFLRTVDTPQFDIGLSAIPYRDDIVNLLLHKDERMSLASTSSQGSTEKSRNGDDSMRLLDNTDETSVSRGFLLVFLSKLPDIDSGLSKQRAGRSLALHHQKASRQDSAFLEKRNYHARGERDRSCVF